MPGMPGTPQQQPQLPPVQLSPIDGKAKIFDMRGVPITSGDDYFINAANQQISERDNSFNQSRLMPMQFQQQAPGTTLDVSPTETTQDTESDTSKNLNAELDKYNYIFDNIFKSLYDSRICDLDETITNKIKIEEKTNELEAKQEIIKNATYTLEQEQQKYRTSVNSLTADNDKIMNELRKKDEQLTELKNLLETKASKETPDKGDKEEIEKYTRKIENLEKNVRDLKTEVQEKTAAISSMEQRSNDAKRSADSLSNDSNDYAEQIKKLKRDLTKANEDLEQRDRDKEREIDRLNKQIQQSKGDEKENFENERKQLISKYEKEKEAAEKAVQAEHNKIQNELESYKAKLSALSATKEQITQDLNNEKSANQELTKTLNRNNQAYESEVVKIKGEAERTNISLENDHKRIIDALKSDHTHAINDLNKRLATTEADASKAQSMNDQMSQRVNEMDRERKQIEQQQQQQQLQQQQLQQLIEQDKNKIEDLKNTINLNELALNEEKSKIQNLEKELQKLLQQESEYAIKKRDIEQQMERLKSNKDFEINEKQERISNLEEQLQTLQSEAYRCKEEKKNIEQEIDELRNQNGESEDEREFKYGFNWESVPNKNHAKLKEYTGNIKALKDFKSRGTKISDTKKDEIISALKNNPQDISIISVTLNNGNKIDNFRISKSTIDTYFNNSDYIIISILYNDNYYTFKALKNSIRPFKSKLPQQSRQPQQSILPQQSSRLQQGGEKTKKKKQKKGGFGGSYGGPFYNPGQPMASTSPPPPAMPMVMSPQQLVSQQQPQGSNQNQVPNQNDIKNEFLKLEKFNKTLERYKLSKNRDLSGLIKLYSDNFKLMKKKFDKNEYKDNYQNLCNEFNQIYQIFKDIKEKLSDPSIKEEGEHANKIAKSIDNFVSKISQKFNDPTKLKDPLFNDSNHTMIEDIINSIYMFIIFIIAIASIIIVILNILNIIRYLYECFKEIGNLNHNNLSTGNTFRYKLFKYLFYIDSCSIPDIINQYNTPGASSGTLITLSTAINKFTLDFGNFFERNSIEEEEGYKVSDKVKEATSKLGQDGMRESLGNFKFMDNATDALIKEQRENYKIRSITKKMIDKWKDENEDRKDEDEAVIEEELADRYEESLKKEYRETVKNNNEPFFNIFFMLRLNFFVIRLVITLINIFFVATLILIILKLINDNKTDQFNIMPNLPSHITSIFVISVFFVIINIVLYKFIYIKIYEKQLNTYLYIHSIDLRITEFITKYKDSSDITTIDKNFYDILKDNIDNKGLILNQINAIIDDKNLDKDLDKDTIKQKCISHIMLYVLVLHIYNSFEKRKNSHLDVLNNFVLQDGSADTFKINKENFKGDTYYSFIGSKFRKESIQYFEDDIDNIAESNIPVYNEIKVDVNKYIAELNDLIVIVNNEFYDDYYIIQFGVYFLVNLVISVIYIITLMGLATKIKAVCEIFKEKCDEAVPL